MNTKRRCTKYVSGDVILTTRQGVRVRYTPTAGSTRQYTVVCPHGEVALARTQADAREDARNPDWCVECRNDS